MPFDEPHETISWPCRLKRWLWHRLAPWWLPVLILLIVCWLLCQPFRIPSLSMHPTLNGTGDYLRDDRVLVNKFVFGPRFPFDGLDIPFTKLRLWYAHHRLWRGAAPKRWDVVVFKSVNADPDHSVLIKRIVGLPGEHVRVTYGQIYINGEPLAPPEPLRASLNYTTILMPSEGMAARFLVQLTHDGVMPGMLNPGNKNVQTLYEDLERLAPVVATLDMKHLTDEQALELVSGLNPTSLQVAKDALRKQFAMQTPFRYGLKDEEEFSRVPEGCYFVLGDNGPNSVDSRYFGWVPNENILGRAFCIFWPLNRLADLSGFYETRWGKGLLFGIPGMLFLYTLISGIWFAVWRTANGAPGIKRGEFVVICRTAYGIRIPALHLHFGKKQPQPGEIIVFRGTDDWWFGHPWRIAQVISAEDPRLAPQQEGAYSSVAQSSFAVVMDSPDGQRKDVLQWIRNVDLVGQVNVRKTQEQ